MEVIVTTVLAVALIVTDDISGVNGNSLTRVHEPTMATICSLRSIGGHLHVGYLLWGARLVAMIV